MSVLEKASDVIDCLGQAGEPVTLAHVRSALSMPSAIEVVEKAAEAIKARGGTLSLDPNLRKELTYDAATQRRFAGIVAMSDLLLPSGEELDRAAGVAGQQAALARLFDLGVREVALKQGAAGATVFRPGAPPVSAPPAHPASSSASKATLMFSPSQRRSSPGTRPSSRAAC